MEKSYNPVNCSPRKFYDKLRELYPQWKESGLSNNIGRLDGQGALDPREFSEDTTLEIVFSKLSLPGYCIIKVNPYSIRRSYSKSKKTEQGSVVMNGTNVRITKNAAKTLEKLTDISLREIK